MNRKIVISLVLGVGFIVAGLLLFGFMKSLRPPQERKEFTAANVRFVQTMALNSAEEHVKLKGFGTVKPRVAVAVPAEIPGRITYRHPELETGALLPADTILFRIDPDTYRIQLQKAESNLANSLAQREVLETEIKGFNRSIEISSEQVELAKRELERFQRLARDEATSKSQVDKMQIALQNALTAKVKDENSLRQATARRASVQAGIQQSEAALAEAKLNLSKTEIKTPFACRVESRKAEAGEFVAAGKVLADLYDPQTLEVHIPTSLSDLAWLLPPNETGHPSKEAALNSEALVTFCLAGNGNGGGTVCWRGRIARLAGTIDEKTRTVDVVVAIPDTALPGAVSNLPLLKGTFVEVELQGKALSNTFRIPRGTISRNDTVNIFVDGKLEVRPVKVVKLEEEHAYIEQGLKAGDLLITTLLPETIPGLPLAIASPTSR